VLLAGFAGDVENSQAPKALTCDIDESGHDDLRQGCCVKWRPGPPQVRPLRHTSTIRTASLKAQQPASQGFVP
jgi:hypothetical protein